MTVVRPLLAVSLTVLTLTACGKKPETVEVATTSEKSAPTSAPAEGKPVKINDGEPVDGDVTLTVSATATAGSALTVAFTGPANAADYVDVVPRGYTQTTGELAYIYVPAAATGQTLRLPTTPGDYDVRYVLDLRGERKIKSVQPLNITSAEASLTVPATVSGAEPLSIAWTGPAGQGDYIDVVAKGYAATSGEISYAYTSTGKPATFSAPGKSGEYEIRYVLEGSGSRQVLASSPLVVTMATASLTAPATAAKGRKLVVVYEGPKREGDYVDLVKSGYVATSGELSYFYANGTAPNELTLPAEPGAYDIRYVMNAPDGRIVLTKRVIEVR